MVVRKEWKELSLYGQRKFSVEFSQRFPMFTFSLIIRSRALIFILENITKVVFGQSFKQIIEIKKKNFKGGTWEEEGLTEDQKHKRAF